MKAKRFSFSILACLLLLVPLSTVSQEVPNYFVQVTTMHWNLDREDFDFNDWRDVESEFHEKVIMPNKYILSRTVLRHHFTDDSSEILFVTVYPSWSAIELAGEENNALIEAAWADPESRKAYMNKRNHFYATEHSDEIYKTIEGRKTLEELELPLIYYVRTSHFKFPDDGTDDEFMSVLNTFNQVVTHNNPHYKAYYPQVHYYGADRTEFIEVFVAETLAELEKGIEKQGNLFRAHWDTDEKQEVYNTLMDKYLTGKHGDRIYSSVPELHKPIETPEND